MNKHFITRLLLPLAVLAPSAAMAHTGDHSASGFLSGMLHPFAGLDHLLAMVAVGIVAAQQAGKAQLTLPIAFMGAMLLGALTGMMGVSLPYMESGIRVSLMVLGLIALTAVRLPLIINASLFALFALFHGQAHGSEIPAGANAISYSLGFTLATLLIQGSALIAANRVIRVNANLLNRLAGAGIVLSGMVLATA